MTMVEKHQLKYSSSLDSYLTQKYQSALCARCLKEFFYGEATEEITLVLSSEKRPYAYHVKTCHVYKYCIVTLSNREKHLKRVYPWMFDIINSKFNGTVWLSIEG